VTDVSPDVRGEILASDVSEETYLRDFAHDFCEYIEGVVLKMSPVTDAHDRIAYLLRQLLAAYLEMRPLGQIRSAPFALKLPIDPTRWREPDVMLILDTNDGTRQPTFFHGAPDIVIEVVSAESVRRDYGEKFLEYERSGAREYWLIDPERQNAQFYRLSERGKYRAESLNSDGEYGCAVLPQLRIPVALLWREAPLGPLEASRLIQAMLDA